MSFEEPNFKTPKQEQVDDEKIYSEKEAKTMNRRSFLKGAGLAGTVGIASHIENKMGKAEKALQFIKKVFQRLKNENIEKKQKDNIAEYYLKAFEELKLKEEFFPKEIFTRDLLIAQQLQESGYKANAKSHVGAVGIMQNMDISIKDVSQFLEHLDRDGVIDYNGPIYINPHDPQKIQNRKKEKYKNRVLKKSDLVSLEYLRVDNPDYSKALGKLYLMRLYNKKYGYGAGQKLFAQGKIKEAQTEILGAYNAGYNQVKNTPKEKWKYEEPKKYVDKIFNYMKRLSNVRKAMEDIGLNKNNDSIAMRTARELDKVHVHGEKRKEILDKTSKYILQTIKKEQDKKGRELNEEEIIKVFSNFASRTDINEELFYTQK